MFRLESQVKGVQLGVGCLTRHASNSTLQLLILRSQGDALQMSQS